MKKKPDQHSKLVPLQSIYKIADLPAQPLSFTSKIGSTCDLGVQTITLSPGASSCCGSGCCCSSSCCW